MFPSRNVAIHILKGVLGFGFLAIALRYSTVLGWFTLIPLVCALICFGGCPMCWTVGLVETLLRRKSRTACPVKTDISPASR
jgi:hypothetical protein